ncbi:hypothetical protein ILYODFUR_034596 [Ilyodon furcidens]|uniref:Uncharacterized protein n=1 Tax=Ilyodon furcidens TaxID=33524 RepID=A0ABV0VJI2_9TELE
MVSVCSFRACKGGWRGRLMRSLVFHHTKLKKAHHWVHVGHLRVYENNNKKTGAHRVCVCANAEEDMADVRGNLQCECKYHSWALEMECVNGSLGVQPDVQFES